MKRATGPTETALYKHRRSLTARDFRFRKKRNSENKDADQLRGYREADLRLCFRICKMLFFHDVAHLVSTFPPGVRVGLNCPVSGHCLLLILQRIG